MISSVNLDLAPPFPSLQRPQAPGSVSGVQPSRLNPSHAQTLTTDQDRAGLRGPWEFSGHTDCTAPQHTNAACFVHRQNNAALEHVPPTLSKYTSTPIGGRRRARALDMPGAVVDARRQSPILPSPMLAFFRPHRRCPRPDSKRLGDLTDIGRRTDPAAADTSHVSTNATGWPDRRSGPW